MVKMIPLKLDKEFIFLSLLFLILPLICNLDFQVKGVTGIGLLLCFSATGLTFRLFHCRQFVFAWPDLFFMIWVGWNILGILFVRKFLPDGLLVLENISWILLYFWLRRRGNIFGLLPVILFSAFIQAVIAIFQNHVLLTGNGSWFPVSGSFHNPAVLGGFLMIGLLLSVTLYRRLVRVVGKIVWVLLVLIIGYACICADSRAAWIGLLAGCILGITEMYPQWWKEHRWVLLLVLLGIVAGIVGLYLYRRGSADGRLLIWQVTFNMFREAPLTGNGPFSFPENYMPAQADYLLSFPNAYGWRQAGNNFLAFNEYFRILSEQGVIGLVLFFVFLGSLWKRTCLRSEESLVYKVILIGWLVFACFSYPASMMPMMLIFVVLSAGMVETSEKEVVWKISSGSWEKGFVIVLSLNVLCFGIWGFVQYKMADKRLEAARSNAEILNTTELKADYNLLYRNADYVLAYAWMLHQAGFYERAIPVLEQATRLKPSADIYRDLGNCYARRGKTAEAEKAYQTAVAMLPAYMEPLYHLFVFYLEAGETEKAREQALKLNRMKPLRVNTVTLKIRKRVREFLTAGESPGDVGQ